MKKGQGLSINVIIVAAIALLILVVLTLIFTGKLSVFAKKIDRCPQTCVDTVDLCSGIYQDIDSSYSCDQNRDGEYSRNQDDGYCCISVV